MDEKQFQAGAIPLELPHIHQPTMPKTRLSAFRKLVICLLFAVLTRYLMLSLLSDRHTARSPSAGPSSTHMSTMDSNHSLVPLEAHIMSKCPDARDCLRDLVVPAMEKVVDKVNFTLSFIGSYVACSPLGL